MVPFWFSNGYKVLSRPIYFVWFSKQNEPFKYSGDQNIGHSNTGNIWLPDKSMFGNRMAIAIPKPDKFVRFSNDLVFENRTGHF